MIGVIAIVGVLIVKNNSTDPIAKIEKKAVKRY
jgi:hypothetical protein